MSDSTGSNASSTSAAGLDILEKMWSMMRLPFPGMPSGLGSQALNPSLAMMPDMISPLTNVDELDKRITDMRAVEQWLKLNLNMLQSAIQALEVQRATLATLKAFGAFAQTSMESAANLAASNPRSAVHGESDVKQTPEPDPNPDVADTASAANRASMGVDPTAWWNVLQSQFNQIAALAMATADTSQTPARPANAAPRATPSAAKPAGAGAPKRPRKASAPKTPKPAGKA